MSKVYTSDIHLSIGQFKIFTVSLIPIMVIIGTKARLTNTLILEIIRLVKKKGLINNQVIIVALIVVLVIGLLAGYYLGKQNSPMQPQTTTTTQVKSTPSVSPSNLQVYNSSKNNFSINYPNDWKIDTQVYQGSGTNLVDETVNFVNNKVDPSHDLRVFIYVVKNSNVDKFNKSYVLYRWGDLGNEKKVVGDSTYFFATGYDPQEGAAPSLQNQQIDKDAMEQIFKSFKSTN